MHKKVAVLNLEQGMPSVDTALGRMKNALTTYKRQGCKAVIIIHGYGSTGVGGRIKAAVVKALHDPGLSGIVRAFTGGEEWTVQKREMLGYCKALADRQRHIAGNHGVTVVILR